MKCVPVGKQFEPDPGEDKWVLKKDHSIEVLYEDFQDIAAGGWRNKVPSMAVQHPLEMLSNCLSFAWCTTYSHALQQT